jgi:hypothetical protein
MRGVFRSLARVAALLLLLAAAPWTASAQELKDREVRPAFDFSLIQMPVEFLSVRLKGRELRPGEKIKGYDDWVKSLSFTLKNVSDKPIAYVEVGLKFPRPDGFVVYILPYGVDFSRGDSRDKTSPPPIEPGAAVTIVLTEERYRSLLYVLDRGNIAKSFDVAPYFIEKVCFEGEPDIIWTGGVLKRRDPERPTEFKTFERYALPAKQE